MSFTRFSRSVFGLRRTLIFSDTPKILINLHRRCSYAGDGKTVMQSVNTGISEILLLKSFSPDGFRLVDGTFVLGPVALFPKYIFHWNVADASDINEESLSLFYLIEPKLDFLIIGKGDEKQKVDQKLISNLLRKRIQIEVHSTEQAIGTYNYLAFDRRKVAAALIPPLRVWADDYSVTELNARLGENDLSENWSSRVALLKDRELEFEYRSTELKQKRIKGEITADEFQAQLSRLQKELFPLKQSFYTEEEKKGYLSLKQSTKEGKKLETENKTLLNKPNDQAKSENSNNTSDESHKGR